MRVRLTGITSVVLCAAALNAASAAPVYSYIDEKGPGSLGVVLEDHREGGILCGVKGWYRLSTDEGRTWKKLYPYTRGAGRHLLRLKDGRLLGIVPEIVENIVGNKLKAANYYAYFSSDEGRSWQGRVPISTENRRLYLMNDRIIRLSTGRILVPFSLHPNELLDKKAESVGWVNAFYSDDEGATWREGKRRPTSAADQMCEPNAIERDDGTLVMLARTGKGYLYRCDSTDGGETWSEERPTTLRSPLAPFHMSKDPYTGWVFIAWHNSFPGPVVQCPRSPLSLAVSRDGCDSWEFICDIENDPMSSYGYPAFHFTRDSVIVAYYETLGHRKFVKEEQHAKVAVFKRSELTVDRVVKEPLTPSAANVRHAPHLRGRLSDSARYERLHPRFAKAFAFLRRADLADLPCGRYEIDGADCWATVSTARLKPFSDVNTYESHRAFIDIQAPITGRETYGVTVAERKDFARFDVKKDCALFTRKGEAWTLAPGEFAIFFPGAGAHAPGLSDDGARTIRKVVVKVRY